MKERYQNPMVGDTLKLRAYSFNGAFPANVNSVQKVEIYRLFATEKTVDNPQGKVLVETIDGSDVITDDEGKYSIELTLSSPTYTVDRYSDEWTLLLEDTMPEGVFEGYFQIYPSAWFVDTHPIIHDFDFDLTPSKVVQGSKKYIQVEVNPNVPRGTERQRYYANMIAGGDLYIYMEQRCGSCVPEEEDLRKVIDRELITTRDHCVGYYFLDTTEMDCGVYHVWFELTLGSNVYISDKKPLQIYS